MKKSSFDKARLLYAGLIAVSALWLAGIILAPLLVAREQVFAGTFLYAAFSAICHQRPERSFYLESLPLAVCARCLGIYAGFFAALVIYPLLRRLDDERVPHRGWLLAAMAPMLIDFAGGMSGIFENTHLSRAVTGAIAGASLVFYLVPGLISAFTTLFIEQLARKSMRSQS